MWSWEKSGKWREKRRAHEKHACFPDNPQLYEFSGGNQNSFCRLLLGLLKQGKMNCW